MITGIKDYQGYIPVHILLCKSSNSVECDILPALHSLTGRDSNRHSLIGKTYSIEKVREIHDQFISLS